MVYKSLFNGVIEILSFVHDGWEKVTFDICLKYFMDFVV